MKPASKKPKEKHPAAPRAAPPNLSATWLAVTLALVTFLACGRIATHGFTWWDDHQTLHRNPDFNPPTLAGIARYWTEPAAGLYAPVTYTVWGALAFIAHGDRADAYGNRLDPALFHLASILTHIGSALLVMALLRRLLPGDAHTTSDRTPWAAFAGAALYALHPVQVEAVAWASGLKDLLFGFFSLLTLWQYTAWAQPPLPSAEAQRAPRRYAFALAAAALAMLSKPTAVVIPLAAFVIDYWLIQRPLRKVILSLAPFIAMAAVAAIIARAAQPASHVTAPPIWARPLIVGDALAFYLYKLVFPLHLAVDYGRRPAAILGKWWLYITWLLPATVALAAWLYRRTAPHLLAAALLFVIGALPVLGLLAFEFQGYSTVADHYLYLSMLGPALALAWALHRFPTPRLAAACGLILALLWLRTLLQTRHWRDDAALWTHNLTVNPRSFLAWTNLGFWHDLHRRHDRATEMYRQAVQITDDYANVRAMYSLANNLLRANRHAEAALWYQKVIDTSLKVPPEARTTAPLEEARHRLTLALQAAAQPNPPEP